jgi:phosphinothricin acetyltransferase
MRTRLVEPRDAEATRSIYNVEVLESTVTFDITPRTLADQQVWIAEHSGGHPAIVAVDDDAVIGFASLSPFKPRAAYAPTVEDSVYVDRNARGRGVGELLLREIMRLGTDHGFHSTVARIVLMQRML